MSKTTTNHSGLILLLGLLTAFGPMNIDMYLPDFPAIAREFGVGIAPVQYTLAAYMGGLALEQLLYGPLADQYGRRPSLLAGMGLYAVATADCALSTSVGSLVEWRVVQAVGGCSGLVLSFAIVRDTFAGNEAARIFSTMLLVMGLAPILAPTVGSFIVAHASWRLLFWLLMGLGVLTLTHIGRSLPETLPAERRDPTAMRVAHEGTVAEQRAVPSWATRSRREWCRRLCSLHHWLAVCVHAVARLVCSAIRAALRPQCQWAGCCRAT